MVPVYTLGKEGDVGGRDSISNDSLSCSLR